MFVNFTDLYGDRARTYKKRFNGVNRHVKQPKILPSTVKKAVAISRQTVFKVFQTSLFQLLISGCSFPPWHSIPDINSIKQSSVVSFCSGSWCFVKEKVAKIIFLSKTTFIKLSLKYSLVEFSKRLRANEFFYEGHFFKMLQ